MMKITRFLILFQCMFLFTQIDALAQSSVTIGTSTSSSATRGPFQRSSTGSTSVFSRASMVYTAAELTSLTSTSTINSIEFDLGSENIITATGNATMLIYMKNSSATEVAAVDSDWSDIINGATLVGTYTFNTTNNFPGTEGFLSFDLDTDFDYTGDALEVAVDWDCSNLVSIGTDATELFSGNGSLNWHWSATSHTSLIYDVSSSSGPSALDSSSRRKAERVNTKINFTDSGSNSNAEQLLTIGTSTSSSATRGPFQRSSTGSTSVFSRASMVYTAAELTSLTSSATISEIKFDLGSENIITATGNATMLIYMKNSSATEVAAVDSDWSDIINGATLVGTYTFNTTNNFPGTEGFLSFDLDADFNYTGGALEVAVDWDCSNLVSIGADATELFSGNGSLNWHWSATSHTSLIYDVSSSSGPSALDSSSRRKSERVNTEIVYQSSGTLSIAESDFSTMFQLSPNPASDNVTVITEEAVDAIEIYDMLGKSVNVDVNNSNVNVSSLASGVYFVKVTSGNAVAIKRLVKK